jgi:hypothetical protein
MKYAHTALGIVMLSAVLLAAAAPDLARAQDEAEAPTYGWKNGFLGGFKLTQAGFSNWAAGGENALAWQLTSTGRFLYDQEAYDWSNWFKLGYGMTKTGDEESRKSVDEIKLESMLDAKLNGPLGAYGAFNWETQFAKGYTYTDTSRTAVSDFMNPGYFTESIGMRYTYQEMVATRIGFTAKQTVAHNYPAFSDDPDTPEIENVRAEYGAEWVTDFNYEISKTLVYLTRVNLFSNMKGLDETDVKWDNTFAAAVAPFVDVTFDFNLVYDRDISTAVQIKEALAIGLIFKLGTKVE